MKKSLLAAAMALLSTAANAQYITEGGFDLTKGKDYVVFYAPQDVVTKMDGKIASDQNLDPDQKKNYLMFWTRDWDKTTLTIINFAEAGVKNSFGGDEFKTLTPLDAWGTGVFTAVDTKYDFSMIDDDYIMHLGVRNPGGKPTNVQFGIGGDKVNLRLADKTDGDYELYYNDGGLIDAAQIPQDAKWYSLDIPVKDLKDSKKFGFTNPGFTAAKDEALRISFVNPTVSVANGVLEPGNTVKTYDVPTVLNSAISFDSFFFYKAESNGINSISNEAAAKNGATYNLAGQRVAEGYKGIVIKNGRKYINK